MVRKLPPLAHSSKTSPVTLMGAICCTRMTAILTFDDKVINMLQYLLLCLLHLFVYHRKSQLCLALPSVKFCTSGRLHILKNLIWKQLLGLPSHGRGWEIRTILSFPFSREHGVRSFNYLP